MKSLATLQPGDLCGAPDRTGPSNTQAKTTAPDPQKLGEGLELGRFEGFGGPVR